MLVWAVAVGFENTVSISAKSNVSRVVQDFMILVLVLLKKMRTWGQSKISSCCFLV